MVWAAVGLVAAVIAANLLVGRLPRKPRPDGEWIDTSNGVRLHYRERQGFGPPVVFIHGMPGLAQDFDGIAALLHGRHTITIDRPGYGHSKGGPRDVAGQVTALLDLLDALAVERAVLAGHSFGGMLSLTFAAEHPERVAALTLIAPAGGGTRVGEQRLRQARIVRALQTPGIRHVADLFFLRALRKVAAEQGARAAYGPEPEMAATRARAVAVLAQHDDIAALMNDRLLFNDAERAMTARLGSIAAPAIVVHGAEDNVVSARRGGRVAEALPAAELRVTPGDHVLPVRHPDIVAHAIEDVLARVAPESGA